MGMERLKRATVVVAVLASLGLGVDLLSTIVWSDTGAVRAEGSATAVVPSSFVEYTVVVKEAGREETSPSRQTQAVRSDGATLLLLELVGRNVTSRRSLRFLDGLAVEIDDIRGLKSSTFNPRRPPSEILRDPRQQCLTAVAGSSASPGHAAGFETVGGHRAAKVIMGNTTAWFAVDLGCARLGSRTTLGDSTHRKELELALAGAPDPVLFDVPDGYREVPPSELYRLDKASIPGIRHDTYYQRFGVQHVAK